MDSVEQLRASHDRQRILCDRMAHGRDIDVMHAAFRELAREVELHAVAEERLLYAPMLLTDDGLRTVREVLTGHLDAVALVTGLRTVDPRSGEWRRAVVELCRVLRGHLEVEERELFPMAAEQLHP